MLVLASLQPAESADPRRAPRLPAHSRAMMRRIKDVPEEVELLDLSSHGCGFHSRRLFVPGTRLFLNLPGLQPWLATVAWFEEGRGGLEFDRPLHPAVAARFAAAPRPGARPCAS
jgi:hypothetical protein